MFSVYANGNKKVYGIKHYTVDEESDIESLPKGITPGSTAKVIASGKSYMLNNNYEWKPLPSSGGSGSGGEVVYVDAEALTEPEILSLLN